MKKNGILNPELARAIASLGQGDIVVICDAAFPIPTSAQRIDLAVTGNVPRFMSVLAAILKELQVERAVVARDMTSKSPDLHQVVLKALGDARLDQVGHEELKHLASRARFVVRTGELTPFANIALYCGAVS